ncbi:MAG TPA: hypothetical protein PK812_05270 [Beijerinckiaceae bacterium]|nr:hypothetical protein [Beijerinckiaceae bacterium]
MYQAMTLAVDPIAGPAAKVSGRQLANVAGLDPQLAINQNSLLKVGGDQIADGVRAHMANLLDLERKVKPRRAGDDSEMAITELGGSKDPAGTKVLGETQTAIGGDNALQNLTDAFEYATNAALVSLVLGGVTNSITTLTTRGG